MTIKHIDATEAHALAGKGALLIDVRGPGEFASECIPGAINLPLPALGQDQLGTGAPAVIYYCKSGARTRINAALLDKVSAVEAYTLDGGIEAWKAAAFPVNRQHEVPAGGGAMAKLLKRFLPHRQGN